MEETYGADALWMVGVLTAATTITLTWIFMSVTESIHLNNQSDIWRSALGREQARATQAEKLVMQYKRSARLAQERLEEINGPKVEHTTTYS
jgi:hypothetical protein